VPLSKTDEQNKEEILNDYIEQLQNTYELIKKRSTKEVK